MEGEEPLLILRQDGRYVVSLDGDERREMMSREREMTRDIENTALRAKVASLEARMKKLEARLGGLESRGHGGSY